MNLLGEVVQRAQVFTEKVTVTNDRDNILKEIDHNYVRYLWKD